MPPEEFGKWDMLWAWVFIIVTGGAGLGLGRLLEYFRTRKPR